MRYTLSPWRARSNLGDGPQPQGEVSGQSGGLEHDFEWAHRRRRRRRHPRARNACRQVGRLSRSFGGSDFGSLSPDAAAASLF